MDGLLLVRKPAGPTSHDVVARLRKILGQKKIGHFGTLDPLASGLLVVAAGRATRFFPYYSKLDKTYEGRIRLGFATDTYDREGRPYGPGNRPAARSRRPPLGDEILRRGNPPAAPRLFGQEARGKAPLCLCPPRGEPSNRRPCPVTVAAFELRSYDPPFLDFRVECGSGTYIRSLAHDLGAALGCGGHLAELVRTRVGDFSLAAALTLEEIGALQARSETGRLPSPSRSSSPRAASLRPHGRRRPADEGRPAGRTRPPGLGGRDRTVPRPIRRPSSACSDRTARSWPWPGPLPRPPCSPRFSSSCKVFVLRP